MRYLFLLLILVGCGEENHTFILDDHKAQIDANTALSESNADRIRLLEERLGLLEQQVIQNEENLILTIEELTAAMISGDNDVMEAAMSEVNRLDEQLSELSYDVNRRIDFLSMIVYRNHIEFVRFKLSQMFTNRRLEIQLHQVNQRISLNEQRISRLRMEMMINDSMLNARINGVMVYFSQQLNSLNSRFTSITNDLQTQINDLDARLTNVEESEWDVVYPCGEGNSKEVLIKTPEGYLAYFQEGVNRTISFNANDTVPTHLVCTDWAGTHHGVDDKTDNQCIKFTEVQGYTTNVSTSIQVFELTKAYLGLLANGNYRTTDGFQCNFSIPLGGNR